MDYFFTHRFIFAQTATECNSDAICAEGLVGGGSGLFTAFARNGSNGHVRHLSELSLCQCHNIILSVCVLPPGSTIFILQ